MPTMTSLTSAPTPSQMAAMALTKLSLVARNALAAYLIVSADAGSVTMTCACTPSYSAPTAIAAARSSQPTTTRSGRRKSSTAEPSRRNSGLRHDAHVGALQDPLDDLGAADRHGRLVDDDALVGQRRRRSRRRRPRRRLRSAEPSSPCGVGTHRNTISQSATALTAPTHEPQVAVGAGPRRPARRGGARRSGSRRGSAARPCRHRCRRTPRRGRDARSTPPWSDRHSRSR